MFSLIVELIVEPVCFHMECGIALGHVTAKGSGENRPTQHSEDQTSHTHFRSGH